VPIYKQENNQLKTKEVKMKSLTKLMTIVAAGALALALSACGSSPPKSLGVPHLPPKTIQRETLYQAGSLAFHAALPGVPGSVVRFRFSDNPAILSANHTPAGCEIGVYDGHGGIVRALTTSGQPTTLADASVVEGVGAFRCNAQGMASILNGMHLVKHPNAWFLSQQVPKGVKVYAESGQSLLQQMEQAGWGKTEGYTLDETAINLVIIKGHDGISLLVMAPTSSAAHKFLATFEAQ